LIYKILLRDNSINNIPTLTHQFSPKEDHFKNLTLIFKT
jgi:hypothetical protein